MNRAVVAFPAFDPPEALYGVIDGIRTLEPDRPVLVYDDGSSPESAPLFDRIGRDFPDITILRHDVNMGKGRTLKDIIRHIQNNDPGSGVVCADSDGQHLPADILRIAARLEAGDSALILGVRDFSGKDVPARNRFGNDLTRFIFKHLTGMEIADTQTGLRGIAPAIMPELPDLYGERYEFEMEMLLTAWKRHWEPVQIPVSTVYSGRRNESHFNPLVDSIRICFRLLRHIFRFPLPSRSGKKE